MTPDDTNLTTEKLRRTMWAALDARTADGDFWAAVVATHNVQQVRFSAHLPDDDHVYILAAVPCLGSPTTMIVPEAWRPHLPPLPRLLDGRDA